MDAVPTPRFLGWLVLSFVLLHVSVATAQQESSLYAGLHLEATPRGAAVGATGTYSLTRALSAFGELRWSGIKYPQLKCLATDVDTLALLGGSQYYLGDRHYEANLIMRDRGEALLGVRLAGGGRFKFLASFAAGYRSQRITSEVDQTLRSRSIFGCGTFGVNEERPSGPQPLGDPARFESNAGSGVVAVGLGFLLNWESGLQTSVQLMSRHYFYGDSRFRIRDPRQPGNGSEVLRLRDHAPDDELRLHLSALFPLKLGR